MSDTNGFDRHLAGALSRRATPADPCPDAALLAAWMDGALDAEARLACEVHVSSCQRCQAIVVAAAGDSEDAWALAPGNASTPSSSTRPSRWRRLVWSAAPVALAASVLLAVWVARSSRDALVAPVPQVSTDIPLLDAATVGESGSAAHDQPAQGNAQKQTTPPAEEADPARRQRTFVDGRAKEEEDARSDQDTMALARAAKSASEAREAMAEVPVAPAPSPPSAAAAASRSEAPARSPARAGTAKEGSPASSEGSTVERALVTTFASPSRRVSWQLLTGGRIVRIPAAEADPVAFTGDALGYGAAFSDNVAWVVGANGAIWRTADGESWARVIPPSQEDFVRVEIGGPESATVTTLAGQRFTTKDLGATWTRP